MATRGSNEAIENAVRKWLSEAVVEAVQSERGIDSDGDPILHITVVLKRDVAPDKRKMIGLTSHLLRENLTDQAFPIIQFLSLADSKRRSAPT